MTTQDVRKGRRTYSAAVNGKERANFCPKKEDIEAYPHGMNEMGGER